MSYSSRCLNCYELFADVIGDRNVSVIQEGLRAFFNSLY